MRDEWAKDEAGERIVSQPLFLDPNLVNLFYAPSFQNR
jgi:hypothetical protein